ncbi:NAD(P)H-hydrate dehydratase [Priestia koreensis]|uniref:NAD(P)H-hydrate dehydratase n=1 Tax=Priestia koreensis TaxID=284581 RepID=UPI0030188D2F
MKPIVTAKEMYDIDQYTIRNVGISGESLMESAGLVIAQRLKAEIPLNEKVAVLVGKGNNGGDGLVIGRLLQGYGYQVDVWMISSSQDLKGDAKGALLHYENAGYVIRSYQDEKDLFHALLPRYDHVIDALLGIGIKGGPRTPYKEIIDQLNHLHSMVYSIDLPSGIEADGGEIEAAVKANKTFTIQAPKTGAYIFPSANYYGQVETVDIGIPLISIEKSSRYKREWEEGDVVRTFPRRTRSSHKGSYGRGGVVGGSATMIGAPILSSGAALRTGVGLLTIYVPESIRSVVASHITEGMYRGLQEENGYFLGDISFDDVKLGAIAVGPGMGRTEGGTRIVRSVLQQDSTVIVDADGLTHLKKCWDLLQHRKAPTIITPHPGEMSMLMDMTVDEVEHNRFEVSRELATKHNVYVVLKGPFTIVTTPTGEQFVNTTGNPGLAKGGTGDTLTGMILGFVLQHESVQEALSNAVYMHGKVADLLLEKGHSMVDIVATDLIKHLPKALSQLLQHEK